MVYSLWFLEKIEFEKQCQLRWDKSTPWRMVWWLTVFFCNVFVIFQRVVFVRCVILIITTVLLVLKGSTPDPLRWSLWSSLYSILSYLYCTHVLNTNLYVKYAYLRAQLAIGEGGRGVQNLKFGSGNREVDDVQAGVQNITVTVIQVGIEVRSFCSILLRNRIHKSIKIRREGGGGYLWNHMS